MNIACTGEHHQYRYYHHHHHHHHHYYHHHLLSLHWALFLHWTHSCVIIIIVVIIYYCLLLSAVVLSITISTDTTTPRVSYVRITHCTFTPGPGKTFPPASLSLAVSPLVLHSWLLSEMQNQIEIKWRRRRWKWPESD